MEFQPFPKLPRLNRGMVITEKLDGTNAAVCIEPYAGGFDEPDYQEPLAVVDGLALYAQSRKRLIRPGKGNDNYGFAGWVKDHADELAQLGPGHHFGEWWGQGIQRGYGLDERRFSLFNAGRWDECTDDPDTPGDKEFAPRCCHVVPVLATANFNSTVIEGVLEDLRLGGSVAAAGFDRPEGVVVYLSAARTSFKVTLEKDGVPKSAVAA